MGDIELLEKVCKNTDKSVMTNRNVCSGAETNCDFCTAVLTSTYMKVRSQENTQSADIQRR